ARESQLESRRKPNVWTHHSNIKPRYPKPPNAFKQFQSENFGLDMTESGFYDSMAGAREEFAMSPRIRAASLR
ncbi:hypothetical protein, partial [Acidiphilium iwatense]